MIQCEVVSKKIKMTVAAQAMADNGYSIKQKRHHGSPNKMPTNWWDRQNAAPLKLDPKR